ncbi:MAG: hypothetical protein LPH19_14465 [Shewanella sp.]|nr:hypothetical protein [Shewanella sp.]MCF1431923.1 hypothetical protein [Shewanella sp.]
MTAKVSAKQGDFGLEAEYRFTNSDDFIEYGYYNINPDMQLQLGVAMVPFGNPNIASNSWWMSIGYYMGFEEDYDTGVKLVYKKNGWATDIAYFNGAEYSANVYKKYAGDIATGSINVYDDNGNVIGTRDYHSEERNQFNLRQTYTVEHHGGSTTFGGSVQYGQLYNSATNNSGDRHGFALHMSTNYQGWNFTAQAISYEFDAADAEKGTEHMIAFAQGGWLLETADKGQLYTFNVAKTIATDFGSVKLYNDFNVMTPDVEDESFKNSYQNVTGAAITAGPTYSSIDLSFGKNMWGSSLAASGIGLNDGRNEWDARINVNVGYYF